MTQKITKTKLNELAHAYVEAEAAAQAASRVYGKVTEKMVGNELPRKDVSERPEYIAQKEAWAKANALGARLIEWAANSENRKGTGFYFYGITDLHPTANTYAARLARHACLERVKEKVRKNGQLIF